MDCGYESLQQIHDAVGFQVWERDLDRAIPLMRKAMRIPLRNPRTYEDFVIPVEVLVDEAAHRLLKAQADLEEGIRTGNDKLVGSAQDRMIQKNPNWGDAKVFTRDLK